MQIYDSLPTFSEARDLLWNKIDDANVSYDPQVIDPYTLKCMEDTYTSDEFMEINTILSPYKEYIKPRQDMLFMGFEHVHMPTIDFPLPSRATESSAGYDFYLPTDVIVRSEEPVMIKLGVKAHMPKDMVLQLYIRSSLSKKIFLLNAVGIIDADYYNNETNMGEIGVMLQAWAGQEPIELKRGERVVQGIFTRYSTIDLDVPRTSDRTGGFGSTGNN